MGPRLYLTGRWSPLLKALQTSLGLIEAKAKGTLRQSVRNPNYHMGADLLRCSNDVRDFQRRWHVGRRDDETSHQIKALRGVVA